MKILMPEFIGKAYIPVKLKDNALAPTFPFHNILWVWFTARLPDHFPPLQLMSIQPFSHLMESI